MIRWLARRAVFALGIACVSLPFSVCAASKGVPEPPPCAETIEQLERRPLQELFLKKSGEFRLDRAAGCLKSGELEVPAVLLLLPDYTESYAVRVVAPIAKTYVAPKVQMLDANLTPTREVDATGFKRRGTEISTEIFLNAENSMERYLLVQPDLQRVGQFDARLVTVIDPIFVGTGIVMGGKEQTKTVSAVDSGPLVISLLGGRWKAD